MQTQPEHVILVDENDRYKGTMEKMEAHRKGLLHRAFSVFIFNHKNEMILQRRAKHKYHSAGLWSNTCCSHPRFGESVEEAANRRLREEMGFECPLEKSFDFIYKSDFSNGLSEHEFDHVFIGYYNGEIHFNHEEVCEYKFMTLDDVYDDLHNNSSQYTVWFKIAFLKIYEQLKFTNLKSLTA
ncbi:MAG: isopentenyl-diphosphate Delta-isomerase [Flavobacteriales bacterium]